MKALVFLVFILNSAYGQNPYETVFKPEVKILLDSALPLMRSGNLEKCLSIYEKILLIDSTNLLIYGNKEFFERRLKKYDKAVETAKRMVELSPNDPNYYLLTGLLYYKIGDSLNQKKYLEKTINLSDKILDTLNTDEKYRTERIKLQKALAMIFSGDEISGNKLLFKLFKEANLPPEAGGIYPYLNKSRTELFKTWLGEK
jgi:tetratricopeptide (TPR) repeat protein